MCYCVDKEKYLFPSFSGWANNQSWDILARENDKIYYICTHRGFMKMWDPRTHWAAETYMSFWI